MKLRLSDYALILLGCDSKAMREYEQNKIRDEMQLAEANEYARKLSVKVTDQGKAIELLNGLHIEAMQRTKDTLDIVDRLETALYAILNRVPCSDQGGGWFYPHFDGEGNETGTEAVDPAFVFQKMADIAAEALNDPPDA